jgi:hypothetical protein
MDEKVDRRCGGDDENQNKEDVNPDIVNGIMRSLGKGQDDIKPEPISYFRSVPDEELDVPGLEVPDKEE